MTYQELVNNINKSRRQSNYINMVKHKAYSNMIKFNDYIKYLQEVKQYYIKENIMTDGTKVYSLKSKRYVYLTRYTKLPKFRTYRQQLAITYRQLEKWLDLKLQIKRGRMLSRHLDELIKQRIEDEDWFEDEDEFEDEFENPFTEYSDTIQI